jgi:formylglycine-generating enzyme required for sulfatase activity
MGYSRLQDRSPYPTRSPQSRWGWCIPQDLTKNERKAGRLPDGWEYAVPPKLTGGTDPFGPRGRGQPVIRGGSWISRLDYTRSAFRRGWKNRGEQDFIGFRVLLRKTRTEGKK